ncbi:uncharacterized protein PV09_07267 [Verruconis gallopava]|uniref:ABM domain-containing protein n=1 Tax=Verruconis gallopava TaxID=253628 RepID=A0A0D2A350_9PEZI|nr:uncharacterized protein PV09_07267 [Verruconis gallopava]KIW01223.1 hypothetical protein PV09_07267 [Verruconis gallopava]
MSLDPNSLVYVVAQLKVAPGKLDEVLGGFTEMASKVEAGEPGCLSYQYFYNEKDGELAVFEIYKDMAAVEAHRNSEHFKEATGARSEGLFTEPPKFSILQRKGGFRRF